jgi:putative MFS transporter
LYPAVESAPIRLEYRSPRHNPWWIPPFLGGVPVDVSDANLRLLGVLTFALFFENYDFSVLGNALPQLADSFGLSKTALGDFLSVTRLGALPAFLLIPLADRIGRRRLLLLAVIGMSVGSALTATSHSATQFALFQIATRTCLVTAGVLVVVVVTEEFPAEHRGWGIGMLSGVAAIGFGLGAGLYGFVKSLPFGWRALYLVGALPLVLLPWLRRGVVETQRFTRARGDGANQSLAAALRGAFGPIGELLRTHPRRALALGLLGAASSAGVGVSFQFVSQFLQTDRGWSPGAFAVMSIVFGAFGIIGNPAAGRLGDRLGRRAVAITVLLAFPLCSAAFYLGPAALVAVPWTAMVFLTMANSVIGRALASELFPTAFRGTAGGTQALLETIGVAAGLFAYSRAMESLGRQELVIPLLSLVTVLAVVGVLLVPETARRELESISGDGASSV